MKILIREGKYFDHEDINKNIGILKRGIKIFWF